MAANTSLASSSSSYSSPPYRYFLSRSLPTLLSPASLKFGLCYETPRFLNIRFHTTNSGPVNSHWSPDSDRFGSKGSVKLGDGSSSSSAIDFLTLCHSLKSWDIFIAEMPLINTASDEADEVFRLISCLSDPDYSAYVIDVEISMDQLPSDCRNR